MIPESWKVWLNRFWWARGFLAAIAVLAIIPDIFNLSKYEFLELFHIAVVAWRELLGNVGKALGFIPFFPVVSGELIGLAMFILTVSLPLAVAAYYKLVTSGDGPPWAHLNAIGRTFRVLMWLAFLYALYAAFFLMSSVYLVAVEVPEIGHDPMEFLSVTKDERIQFFIVVVALYGLCLAAFRQYLKAFVVVVTFLITLNGIYYLWNPDFRPNLLGWACPLSDTKFEFCIDL